MAYTTTGPQMPPHAGPHWHPSAEPAPPTAGRPPADDTSPPGYDCSRRCGGRRGWWGRRCQTSAPPENDRCNIPPGQLPPDQDAAKQQPPMHDRRHGHWRHPATGANPGEGTPAYPGYDGSGYAPFRGGAQPFHGYEGAYPGEPGHDPFVHVPFRGGYGPFRGGYPPFHGYGYGYHGGRGYFQGGPENRYIFREFDFL